MGSLEIPINIQVTMKAVLEISIGLLEFPTLCWEHNFQELLQQSWQSHGGGTIALIFFSEQVPLDVSSELSLNVQVQK